jgi:hypothetical protein
VRTVSLAMGLRLGSSGVVNYLAGNLEAIPHSHMSRSTDS